MSEQPATANEFRMWFAALRRAHALAALGVIAVAAALYPFFAPGTALFQLVMAAALTMLLVLPHAALDQYAAFIALKPRLGRFWPVGFLGIYGLVAIGIVLGWLVVPLWTGLFLVLLAALHYGMSDLDAGPVWRWLELTARGFAPFALALLFNPAAIAGFAGWLVYDMVHANRIVHDVLLPAALGWQVLWALIVVRNLWLAVRWSDGRAAMIVAEMTVLVLAFALLPPLIALIFYVGLLHAPRHLVDYALRNPYQGDPRRALLRVVRATVLPTALAIAMIAVLGYLIYDPLAPHAHLLRMAIWLVTAFAAPHAVFSFLALRDWRGLREVSPAHMPDVPSQSRMPASPQVDDQSSR
jgi:Brp/Blh family beta-carotene 15,15'-monooxygenase